MIALKSLPILICIIVTVSHFNFGSCFIHNLPYFKSLSFDSGSNNLFLIGGSGSLHALNVSSTSPYDCQNLYEVDTSYTPSSVVVQNVDNSTLNILFVTQLNKLFQQKFNFNDLTKYDCSATELSIRTNIKYNQIILSPMDSNILYATICDDGSYTNYNKIIKLNIKSNYYSTVINAPCAISSFTLSNNRLFWIQSYSYCSTYNIGVYTSFDDGSFLKKASSINYYFNEIAVNYYTAYLFTSSSYYACKMDTNFNFTSCPQIFNGMPSLHSPTIGNNSLYFISDPDYICSYTYKYDFYYRIITAVIMPSSSICQFNSSYYYSDTYICQQSSSDNCNVFNFPISALIVIGISCLIVLTVFIVCCVLFCRRRRSNIANNSINRVAYRPVSTVPSNFPGMNPNLYRNTSSVNTENSSLIASAAPPPYSETDLTRASLTVPPPAINPYNSIPPPQQQVNNIRSSLPAPIISNNIVPTMATAPPNLNRLTVKFCFNCAQPVAHGFTTCTACGTNLLQLPT